MAEGGIGQQVLHSSSNGGGVERIDEHRAFSGDFGERRTVRREHRTAAGHRFEHGQSEPFYQRWKCKKERVGKTGADLVVAELADEEHPVVQAELPRQPHERRVALAATGEHEREIGMVRGYLCKSADQPRQVFVGQAVAQAKGKRPVCKQCFKSRRCVAQAKQGWFRVVRVPSGGYAVQDDRYLVGRYAAVERGLARTFGHGDDVVGRSHGSPDTPAPERPLNPPPPAPAIGEVGMVHPYQVVQSDDDAPSADADGEKVEQGVVHVGVELVDDPGAAEDVVRRGNVVRCENLPEVGLLGNGAMARRPADDDVLVCAV